MPVSRLFIYVIAGLWAGNLFADTNYLAVAVGTNSAADRELQKIMEQDDEAQADADRWIRDNQKFAAEGAGTADRALNERIRRRFEPVRLAYERFILQHTNHIRARLAYAGFLGDINDTTNQFAQLKLVQALAPDNPVIWNNLANYYGRSGSATNVFTCYGKAIELRPNEPLYHHNLANAMLLFRAEATNFYSLNDQQLFLKALENYQQALKSDPENFPLATDLARVYYDIQPRRTEEALTAWTNALKLAHDSLEREGVQVHLARVKIQAERTNEARAHIGSITNESYSVLKKELATLLIAETTATNSPTSPPEKSENK